MTKTTREVAKELGVKIATLQLWVREGHVEAEVTGEGTQRRLKWHDEAIEQARRMRDRGENGSTIAAVLGTDLLAAMKRAKELKDYQGDGDVIVASPQTARMFRDDRTLGDVLRTMRGSFFIVHR